MTREMKNIFQKANVVHVVRTCKKVLRYACCELMTDGIIKKHFEQLQGTF